MRHLAMEVARQGVTANTLALGLMGVQELTELTRYTARQIPSGGSVPPRTSAPPALTSRPRKRPG